jgi:hypothetical protein
MGQLLDKADGVGEQRFLAAGEGYSAGGGVEGGEQLVLGEDVGGGEGVEEGGFAGVGVADEGDGGDTGRLAALAVQVAVAADLADFPLDFGDAFADAPPVDFELGFARAARADAATQPGEDEALAAEAGKVVFELGQFDLEFAFVGAGPLGEDVEDERGPVEHLGAEGLFEVALLGRRQFVVEDHEVGAFFLAGRGDVLNLSAADEVGGRPDGRAFATGCPVLRRRPFPPAGRVRRVSQPHPSLPGGRRRPGWLSP